MTAGEIINVEYIIHSAALARSLRFVRTARICPSGISLNFIESRLFVFYYQEFRLTATPSTGLQTRTYALCGVYSSALSVLNSTSHRRLAIRITLSDFICYLNYKLPSVRHLRGGHAVEIRVDMETACAIAAVRIVVRASERVS